MNLVDLLLALLAVGSGALLPVQFAVNSHLGKVLGSPLAASVVSFGAGLAMLVAASLVFVRALPGAAALKAMPPYLFYVGGACGAVFVMAAIVATPRIGTAAMVSFAILGQLLAATLIDHLGLLGTTAHPVSLGRLVGVAMVIAGAVLVRVL